MGVHLNFIYMSSEKSFIDGIIPASTDVIQLAKWKIKDARAKSWVIAHVVLKLVLIYIHIKLFKQCGNI